jgi:hypothetical protein
MNTEFHLSHLLLRRHADTGIKIKDSQSKNHAGRIALCWKHHT